MAAIFCGWQGRVRACSRAIPDPDNREDRAGRSKHGWRGTKLMRGGGWLLSIHGCARSWDGGAVRKPPSHRGYRLLRIMEFALSTTEVSRLAR